MRITVRHIQETIAADFGIESREMRSPSRRRDFAWPRQYAMLLARELTPLSSVVIGHLFGRDHSTIITGVRRAEERIAKDKDLALKLEARALLIQSQPNISGDTGNVGFSAVVSDNSAICTHAIHS